MSTDCPIGYKYYIGDECYEVVKETPGSDSIHGCKECKEEIGRRWGMCELLRCSGRVRRDRTYVHWRKIKEQ